MKSFHEGEIVIPIFRRLILNFIRMNNVMLFSWTLALIGISSFLMWLIEPETFTSPFVGLWWTMTTLTTVGYGDVSPSTVFGRIYAMLLFIAGIGLIGVVIGKLVDALTVFSRKRVEGRLDFPGHDHLIFIGWGRNTAFALKELESSDYTGSIVIIDQLPMTPYDQDNVHYIQGDPTDEQTLLRANVKKARSVVLFADHRIEDPALMDGKSLLIATSIERIAPQVHSTVEIMQERNIQNFKHVQVNHFLVSGEFISRLAVRSALLEDHGAIVSQLISRDHGDDLFEFPRRPHWKTYRDAFEELLNAGATLVADNGDLGINRKLDMSIPEDARLQVICNKETFANLAAGERHRMR